MFPAARIADPVSHDLVTSSGIIGPPLKPPTKGPVFIEGMPAAFVTCTVVCTGASGAGMAHPPPAAGAPPVPILLGSPTVLINGFPAARWAPSGDFAACTSQFGSTALAAGRTVFIGGPTTPSGMAFSLDPNGNLRFGNAIQIEGTDLFKSKVANRLLKIGSVASGMRLLQSLESSGKQVMVIEAERGTGCYQYSTDALAGRARGTYSYNHDGSVHLDRSGMPLEGTGAGSDSIVGLDPSDVIDNPYSPSQPASNDAGLAHELIHADRAARGEQDLTPDATFTNAEERAATNGENAYMKDHGFKWHRIDHSTTMRPNE